MSENIAPVETNSLSASDNAAPASTPASTSQPAAPAVAATPTPSANTGVPSTGAPAVEPSWLKSRLDETRASTARQLQSQFQSYLEQERANSRAELERVQTQLRAVLGVTPPANPEIEQVRNQFSQVYPGLSKIEDKAEMIMKIIEQANDLQAQNDHYWEAYGRQTMDNVFKKAEEAIGGALTDEAKRYLHSSFVGWVQSSPENQQRYSSDPSIVDDFVRVVTSSFIDPVRRSASATVQGRAGAVAALPQNDPSGGLRTNNAPKPGNLDERAALAWGLFNSKQNPGG